MIPELAIRNNFSAVSSRYEEWADMQNLLADDLLQDIMLLNMAQGKILDIGCGTGRMLSSIEKDLPGIRCIGLDSSFGMARAAQEKGLASIAADASGLPFAPGIFDLVVSNAAYQWVRNLRAAFMEAARVLKNDGTFIFNCFAAATLKEVRDCFGLSDNFLPDEKSLRLALQSANFREIEIKVYTQKKYFDGLRDILQWLKNIGGNRFYSKPPFLTNNMLNAAGDLYRRNHNDLGKVFATFEIARARARKHDGS